MRHTAGNDGQADDASPVEGRTIDSLAEARRRSSPNVTLLAAGADELATAVLFPHDHDGSALPGAARPVRRSARAPRHSEPTERVPQLASGSPIRGSPWSITDGSGTPGRGTKWERLVHHDLAGTLDDQVVALEAVAAKYDVLDLDRVGIRGWSFGGYLAALAVLQRPDVFHAAVAGAPVTEWRLYDTHYTERYLGDRTSGRTSTTANALPGLAGDLRRPLLLIHGLADDNVVAAHTLRFSSALLAAGKPHEVLPLSGVTHMTPDEVVAENLLLHQLAFLERTLGPEQSGS